MNDRRYSQANLKMSMTQNLIHSLSIFIVGRFTKLKLLLFSPY